MGAFPSQQGAFTTLKELVNVHREKYQSLVNFYYKKLALGQICKLEDSLIVDHKCYNAP